MQFVVLYIALTGGSIGSAFTWNGVSDLPRPADEYDRSVSGVTTIDRDVDPVEGV